MLTSSVLVLFMTIPGLSLFYAGLVRAKNVLSVMMQCFAITCLVTILWTAYAYGLAFGDGGGLNAFIGIGKFFLSGVGVDTLSGTIPESVFQMFQLTFAIITPALIVGAFAERMKFSAMLAFMALWVTVVYAPIAHWVWGGGWLGSLEAIGLPAAADYAGSGVVHAVGGFLALAGAAVVGPRIGKFTNGVPNVLTGHNTPFVVIGTFILFFGWFGFNINTGDSIGLNAMNTLLSGATGAVVALYIQLVRTGKTDILVACNGALAGLVGITAPVAFVEPWSAVVIGAISAPIMLVSVSVIERVFKIDDPVGAISVHGTCGLWGILAVGIFANGNNGVTGLVGGNSMQIVSQLISMGVVLAWALVTGFALFLVLKYTMGVRASEEEELQGLDVSEHGLQAYPAEA
jgi:Amt family ammonium transporter